MHFCVYIQFIAHIKIPCNLLQHILICSLLLLDSFSRNTVILYKQILSKLLNAFILFASFKLCCSLHRFNLRKYEWLVFIKKFYAYFV